MSIMRGLFAILLTATILQAQAPPPTPEAAIAAAVASLEQYQTAQSLTTILRTLQNNIKVSERVKAAVDELVAEATPYRDAGKNGEARRRLLNAISVQRGLPWDQRAEFIGSVLLRTNMTVADSSRALVAQLTQAYAAVSTSGFRLRVTLAEPAPGGKTVREFETHNVVSRDLIDDPFVFSLNTDGLADGVYRMAAELTDGNVSICRVATNVLLVRDLEAQRTEIEKRLARIQGHDGAKATVRYPFDYARVINEGRRDLIAQGTMLNEYFDFAKEVRNSLELVKALEEGKDPLLRAGGEHERHYWFAEGGEVMPYRVFVPKKYDGRAKLPLVVILHGAGADQDSYLRILGNVIREEAEKHGFIIVTPLGYRPRAGWGVRGASITIRSTAPVDPTQKYFSELSEKDGLIVIESVIEEYNVDRSRVYLMGNSMGGGGSWYLAAKYPERWAAVAPAAMFVSEGYPVERIKGLPVMYVHGELDTTVPVEGARQMMKRFKEIGFEIPYVEVKGGSHGRAVWDTLPQIFDFFEKYRRN